MPKLKEIWSQITGIDTPYWISTLGKVRSQRGYLKQQRMTGGYLYVNLPVDGAFKHKSVHRLVAKAFIPNPENKPQVNHKDSIRTNNYVDNLAWATASENNHHAFREGNRKPYTNPLGKDSPRARAVVRVSESGEEKHYDYMSQVLEDGFSPAKVCEVCKGNRTHHKQFKWRYI